MKASLVFVVALAFSGWAHAEQTTEEKAEATKNNVQRTVKKKVHNAEEIVCADGDATCMARKAKHRAQESSDYVKDKTKENVDKVD